MVIKCYIYTRVSTSMQVDGFSLEAQKDRLRRYAEFQDMIIAGEYSDEGKSGKNVAGRPEFLQMISDIESEKDKVDFVLVFKLSRFGRNAADVLNYLQRMQDYGVNLICVEDGIDSSKDAGKLMISVLSAVAEIERDNILVQTMEGRRQKAKEGKWNGGFAPYGYTLINSELKVVEEEAEAIRIIFDKYVNTQMGINGIADYLQKMGIKKIPRQNGKLTHFSHEFIRKALDNPVYCGKIAFGRRKTEKIQGKRNEFHVVKQSEFPVYDGIHEPIVSEEVWNLAHAKRLETGIGQIKKHFLEHEHKLSGIIKCPICGAGMYGNVRQTKREDGTPYKAYYSYQCKHRREVDGELCTYNKQWNEEKVDAAVVDILKSLVHTEKFESAIKEKINSKIDTSSMEAELESFKQTRRKIIISKEKLAQEIDNLDVLDSMYDRKYQDMTDRLYGLYDKLEDIEREIIESEKRIATIKENKVTSNNIYNILIYFDKFYDKFTEKEKKEFFLGLIERVEIFDKKQEDGRIIKKIVFKFPVFVGDEEVTEICWDNQTTVEECDVHEHHGLSASGNFCASRLWMMYRTILKYI